VQRISTSGEVDHLEKWIMLSCQRFEYRMKEKRREQKMVRNLPLLPQLKLS
jgi:hypothetical protein